MMFPLRSRLPVCFWALALLFASCWLPTRTIAQQSQWYHVAVPGYPSGAAATQLFSTGVRRDATGNLIYPIVFKDSLTFQGVHLVSSATADHYDFVIFKLSPTGQLLWHWQPGGSGGNREFAYVELTTDPEQNIILCGALRGGVLTAGGTSLPSPATGSGLFLIKLSPAGQVQWAQALIDVVSSGGEANTTNSMTADHASNILIPGSYYEEVTIGG